MNRRNILLGAAAGRKAALAGFRQPPSPARAGQMAIKHDRRIQC